MTRNWLLPLGLAATAMLGALSLPVLAHEVERGHGSGRMDDRGAYGRGAGAHGGMMDMMRQMHGMHSGMMCGAGMMEAPGMMMGGSSMMGRTGPMGAMMQAFDADSDGTLTPDELRSGLEGRLAEFDADDGGTLSIDEFEALHGALIREMMVDRFQALDNDGDGEVTAEEMTAPADRMQRMQERRNRMMEQRPGADGASDPQATMPMEDTANHGGSTMDGGMMDDHMMEQEETDEPGSG